VSKDALRAQARALLRALPPGERAAAQARIEACVWEVPQVAAARTLLLYASLPEEVATDAIAAEARRRGITLVYPRCLPQGVMTLHAVDAADALRPGRFGIREPQADACPAVEVRDIDAVLIPGLAWDRGGPRLGRGGGYYDRLLAHPDWRGFRCGLFFAAQETPTVPHEPWDVRLDAIVTEREVVRMDETELSQFARVLWEGWHSDRPHAHRLIWCAAVIATALHKVGVRATLVGGGAIELHAPAIYTTGDIDFVFDRGTREQIGPVMEALGFVSRNVRGWEKDDLWVDFPSTEMEDPAETRSVGPYQLRVLPKEIALGYRITGFRHWKYWGYGLQAIALIRAFGSELDETILLPYLKRQGAEPAYELLRDLANSDREITHQQLDELWHRHYR
jgi:5-formyltetrahydrofolate cyclo-ligase